MKKMAAGSLFLYGLRFVRALFVALHSYVLIMNVFFYNLSSSFRFLNIYKILSKMNGRKDNKDDR